MLRPGRFAGRGTGLGRAADCEGGRGMDRAASCCRVWLVVMVVVD